MKSDYFKGATADLSKLISFGFIKEKDTTYKYQTIINQNTLLLIVTFNENFDFDYTVYDITLEEESYAHLSSPTIRMECEEVFSKIKTQCFISTHYLQKQSKFSSWCRKNEDVTCSRLLI